MHRTKNSLCFTLPPTPVVGSPSWVVNLLPAAINELTALFDPHAEHLARLIPALLCGEQSAVWVFHNEKRRLSETLETQSARAIETIENDERAHEQVLNALLQSLPEPEGASLIHRRSRQFFATLNRSEDLAQHFSRVAQLDGAVCQLMQAITQSSLAQYPAFKAVISRIKNDEAKHVSIGRQYAFGLGASRRTLADEGAWIVLQLVDLLTPLSEAFDAFEIDPDRLWKRLLRRYPS